MKNQHDDRGVPLTLVAVESPNAQTCAVNLSVDARQLACPLPLLKAKQGLRNLQPQELLRLMATDAGVLKDLVAFAQLMGQEIVHFGMHDSCYYFVLRKH